MWKSVTSSLCDQVAPENCDLANYIWFRPELKIVSIDVRFMDISLSHVPAFPAVNLSDKYDFFVSLSHVINFAGQYPVTTDALVPTNLAGGRLLLMKD